MLESDSGKTSSTWMKNSLPLPRTTLSENLSTDVCIVGAGIAGLTTAYLLLQKGKSVVVLDDGVIGGGQTARTTAHITSAIDDRYFEIERLHGNRGARLAAESHTNAILQIESIVHREQINCEFERCDGFLFAGLGESTNVLEKELAAAQRAGVAHVQWHHGNVLPGVQTGPALCFPRQAMFDPLKYLNGLALAIERMGGQIFEFTHATKIKGGASAHVNTRGGGTISSSSVVVATNSPVNDTVAIHTKQAPYLSYVIAARIPKGSVPAALYWDTQDPYHYVRIQRGDMHENAQAESKWDLLIVGGEDHKTGQADDASVRYVRLESWAREHFPMMEDIVAKWSGQVMEPVDYLAYIGRNPMDASNVYIATGDSGMGMTHSTIAGMIISDLICEIENSWAALYDPSRVTLRAASEFMRENLNVALQYTDWFTSGDVRDESQIKPGEGAVVRHGMSKVACYRDAGGTLHATSAVCPHLGGIVAWNSSEENWDCPCHGSRFDAYGRVVQGPANSDLEKIRLSDAQSLSETPKNPDTTSRSEGHGRE